MVSLKELKKGFFTSLWFVFLTFPIVVIKADPIEKTVIWRWHNAIYMAIGTFSVYLLIKYYQYRKEHKTHHDDNKEETRSLIHRALQNPRSK